ncbi:molybdate ABC transporter substrate-binding protein [Caenimonas terrae]|uniref:Molybdate ABC transporter substrate-binding protein n=1 Tax=Caenimonas terrae TaxID=696074 RepID=A0ABW0NEQ9_9BURK
MKTRLSWMVCLALALGAPAAALADEVCVLAAGAAKAALEKIGPEFQRATGHTVAAAYDTVGAQRDRVLHGQQCDLVVLSDGAIAQLASAGRLTGEQRQFIGSVAVSLAVPAGAPVPDISTPEALKQALQQAPSIAYADPARGATAGTHFDKVLVQLGLRSALQPKLHLLPFGVDVIKDVAAGKFALGVSQSSEILQHEGIAMAGPLPPPYALTTGYSAAVTSHKPAAQLLLQFMATPAAAAQFRATGFLAP